MQLHPIMAQALRPWMPPTEMPLPSLNELDAMRKRLQAIREEKLDEYRSGLDCVDDGGDCDE